MSDMPVFQSTMNPLLEVLQESPTPLAIDEIERRVEARMGLPPEVLAVPHDPKKPDRSEIGYRIAWARSYMKKAGLLHNPRRGQWTVTDKGRATGSIDVDALLSEQSRSYRSDVAARRKAGVAPSEGDEPGAVDEEEDENAQLEIAAADEEASLARVGSVLARQLTELYETLRAEGELLSREEFAGMLGRFHQRFGPTVLASLDGPALLTRMHGRGGKDSLVHWLEFKEDTDFATSAFGSISGGSALKFGLYQSIETSAWMTGAPAQQVRLEIDDAVALARRQRDELLAAAKMIGALGAPEAIDFDELQARVLEAAPSIADSAWCHKMLSLWFPEVFEPFHVAEHQAHHLRRLLKFSAAGRYANAGMFNGIARQLGMTLLELAKVLVQRNGGPYTTWRVGTRVDEESLWDSMLSGGFAGVSWAGLGDLSDVPHTNDGKEAIRKRLLARGSNNASLLSRETNQLYHFVCKAQERDLIVAMDGTRVLGVGRISGPYEYVSDSHAPHRRRVTWELTGEPWKLPHKEGLMTTFIELKKHPLNLIEIEARLLGKAGATSSSIQATTASRPAKSDSLPPAAPPPLLDGVPGRIDGILSRKRQVILYGPPGTGKTHWATIAAREIVSRSWFGRRASDLTNEHQKVLDAQAAIELVSFHPGYGYEDFLEGYRPAGGGSFELRDGVFKRLCARASSDPRRSYVLVIDEINRGDLPRIFGELLTVIERDKRGRPITLPLSGAPFSVPDNVLIIGTMNTADRSIALLDAALRRRFGFVELPPDTTVFRGIKVDKIPLEAWLDALNAKIMEHAGRDARNLRVGHAYFMHAGAPVREIARFAEILRDDVIPLLEEVCYEDFDALERILGSRIVQRAKKRIDVDLFEPDRYDALQDAILQAFPSLLTTKAAAEADIEVAVDEGADDATTSDDESENS